MLVPKPYEHYTRINESAIDMEQIKGFRRHDVSFDFTLHPAHRGSYDAPLKRPHATPCLVNLITNTANNNQATQAPLLPPPTRLREPDVSLPLLSGPFPPKR